jgi:hypothetical protein
MQHFEIHDNGGRPFHVNIDGGEVQVRLRKSTDIAHRFHPKRVWVAEGEAYRFSHPNGETYPEGVAFPPLDSAKGNTLLLEDADGSYIHIGPRIVRFKSDEPIEEFRSPLGNSNVPYPFASTSKHTLLFGLGKVLCAPKTDTEDPWGLHFNTDNGVEIPAEELTARQ